MEKTIVAVADAIAMGWFTFDPDKVGKRVGDYAYVAKCMNRVQRVAFKKWWKQRGAQAFAQWLYDNNMAHGYVHKRDGEIVILFASKRGNQIFDERTRRMLP